MQARFVAGQTAMLSFNLNAVARHKVATQQVICQHILQLRLDGALQRPCAE